MFRQPRGYASMPFSYGFCMQESTVPCKFVSAFLRLYIRKNRMFEKGGLKAAVQEKPPPRWKGEFFFLIINDIRSRIKRKASVWRSQKRFQLLDGLLLGGQEFLCKGSGLSVSMRQIVQAFGQADNSHCCAVDGQLGQV